MDVLKEKAIKAFAALGGAVISFFSGMPPLVWILLAVMSLDYITGLICAARGKSDKTPNGKLSSGAAFDGLMKKVLIIFVVLLSALLDHAVAVSADIEFAAVTGACCLWFIASDGLSIVENAAKLGVPIPAILQKMLEIMRDKGGTQENQESK